MKAVIICFSDRGENLANRITEELTDFDTSVIRPMSGCLNQVVMEVFDSTDEIVFVGAMGIAVRAIAPFINSKLTDPGVIVVDELGLNVIPILSGHIGGANDMSVRIANILDSNVCITTATDINKVWAVDSWAISRGFKLKNTERIKYISSAMLRGEEISIYIENIIRDEEIDSVLREYLMQGMPEGMKFTNIENADIVISCHRVDTKGLIIIPNILHAGMGCKRDKSIEDIRELFLKVLEDNELYPEAVADINSIDIKGSEPGLIGLAKELKVKLITYEAGQLNNLAGNFNGSDFVKEITGVNNVCERSALAGNINCKDFEDRLLLVRKQALNGVTMAVAAWY